MILVDNVNIPGEGSEIDTIPSSPKVNDSNIGKSDSVYDVQKSLPNILVPPSIGEYNMKVLLNRR